MTQPRQISTRIIEQRRETRTSPTRSNPRLRAIARSYSDRGYDPVDAVRRAVEDLFPVLPGQTLVFPGLGAWAMGEDRLSHKISNNLRSLRAIPGKMSGEEPYSEDDEEEPVLKL